jgi:DNA-binding LacI/PurR family transcriptional regulator
MGVTKKATISDVAVLAGVATGTVSRVLNRYPDVSDDINRRVMAAASELGYSRLRKHRKTEKQSRRKHGNIGVICFGIGDSLVEIPIIHRTIQGIENTLSEENRNLMLAYIPAGDRVPHFLTQERVDGLILKGPNHGELPSPEENKLIRYINQFPNIWIMGKPVNVCGDESNFDMLEAGRLAASSFLEHGHSRVAFLNGRPGHVQFEKLKDAFRATAERLGIEVDLLEGPAPDGLTWPLPAISSEQDIEKLVVEWKSIRKAERPTGIFVPADHTAIQLYASFARHGIKAGRDVSVLSCNREAMLTANLNPKLASIEVHAEVFGRRAVDQLFWRIAHPKDPHYFEILVKPELIPGESMMRLG